MTCIVIGTHVWHADLQHGPHGCLATLLVPCVISTKRSVVAEELPPYDHQVAKAAVEPGVRELQRLLDQHTDPDTLAGILDSVDGSIEDAITILREAGIKVKPDAMPTARLHVNNVPHHAQQDSGRTGTPPARKASRQARRGLSAPGSPAPGSPLPGSPTRGVRGRNAAAVGCSPAAAGQSTPGQATVAGCHDDTRELAPKEYVWWWNSARGTWVEASVECRNARQLAVEYTLRLPDGRLIDASRADLRPRYAADALPPPPLPTRHCSPQPYPIALNPLRRGFTNAPAAAANHATSHNSSPASSSPIIIDPDGSPSRVESGPTGHDQAGAHSRMDTATSTVATRQVMPQIETWEFLDPAEQNSLRVAREVQEEQDRSYALKLASEMPPDAAALPESDDDDNVGLLTGEAQARATQAIYNRLNQPIKDLIEQIKARRCQRDEARAMRDEHVCGQLTFEVRPAFQSYPAFQSSLPSCV